MRRQHRNPFNVLLSLAATGYHDPGRPEKQEAGSGIPALERTGSGGRTLVENDGSVRSFPIDQAALFRDAPPAPIRGRPMKTRDKKGSFD